MPIINDFPLLGTTSSKGQNAVDHWVKSILNGHSVIIIHELSNFNEMTANKKEVEFLINKTKWSPTVALFSSYERWAAISL